MNYLKKNCGLFLLTVTIIFFCNVNLFAANSEKTEIVVVSDIWENWTNADSAGLVFDLLNLIFADTKQYSINIAYMPYEASTQMVVEKKADIVVGVYENELEGVIFPYWHFEMDNISAVYKKQKNIKWNGIKTIENQKCGFVTAYSYDKYLDVKFEFIEKNDRKDLLEMLMTDEIDFYLDAVIDIETNMRDTNTNPESFEIKTLRNIKAYFCFADNDKGKRLAKIWDDNFKEIVFSARKHELQDIYTKWR